MANVNGIERAEKETNLVQWLKILRYWTGVDSEYMISTVDESNINTSFV